MKRIFLTLSIIAFSICSIFAQSEQVKRTYKFSKITAIEAGFIYNINITEGNSDKVEMIFSKRYEKYIKVSYNEGTLKLSFNSDLWRKHYKNNTNTKNGKITVNLSMKTIDKIDLSGASSLKATGTFVTQKLEYEISGAASTGVINISGNELEIDISGAGNGVINGSFKNVEGDISGAGKFKLTGNSNYIELDNSGAASFVYNGNVSNLFKIENSGAARSKLTGSANQIDISCSGASSVSAQDFATKVAVVGVSGASNVNINVSESLTTQTSGASKITYYGNPARITDKTRNKSVIKGDK